MLRLGTDSDTPNQSEHVRKSLKGSHPWSVAARLPTPAVQGLPEAQEAATDALTALAPAKGWDMPLNSHDTCPQTLGVEKGLETAL